MSKCKTRITGKLWTVEVHDVLDEDAYGMCHFDDRVIQVAQKAFDQEVERETAVHECLHAIFPHYEEEFIDQAAKDIDRLLDTLGI